MKKSYVNAIIIDGTKVISFKRKVALDENGCIKINGGSYEIDKTNFTIYKGLPTFFYSQNNNKPLKPDLSKGEYTSKEYNHGLTEQVLGKLIESLKGNGINISQLLNIIIGLAILVVIGLLIYFYYDLGKQIADLKTLITG